MYTSGTTGKPKGAIRNHAGSALIALVTALDMGLTRDDTALLVMPMCHANSLYFAFTFTYLGAACVIDDHRHFDPEQLLKTLSEQQDHVHVAGADALHHDARPARGRERQVRRRPGQQADDFLGAGATRDQARDHGALPPLGTLRALRLDGGRLGHAAAPARTADEAGLGRTRVDGVGTDQAPRRRAATRCPTARSANSTRARRTSSTATGRIRRRRPRPSAARGARSATSPAAMPMATITWSIARAT